MEDVDVSKKLIDLCNRRSIQSKFEEVVDNDTNQRSCCVTLQPSQVLGSVESQSFRGFGDSKKEAKQEACQNAMNALILHPESFRSPSLPIETVILLTLSAEKLKREGLFKCYLYMAGQLEDDWLPVGLLCPTKVMTMWYAEVCQYERFSIQSMKHQIIHELQSLSGMELEIRNNGAFVRPKNGVSFPPETHAQSFGVEIAKNTWNAVFLSSDPSILPYSVEMKSDRSLVQSVLDCLETDLSDLCILPSGTTTVSIPSLQNLDPDASVDLSSADPSEVSPSAILKQRKLRLPSVWIKGTNGASRNDRASWLFGAEIEGDVLLTLSRPTRHQETTKFEMLWRDFTLTDFWNHVQWKLPQNFYATRLSLPILAKLPLAYEFPSAWQGHLPFKLLELYAQSTCRKMHLHFEDLDEETFEYGIDIEETELSVRDVQDSAERSKQNAAIRMLHLLQEADSKLWLGNRKNVAEVFPSDLEIVVLESGNERQTKIQQGMHVKVRCRLFVKSTQMEQWFLIESSDGFVFRVEDVSVLDRLVVGLTANGKAKATFRGTIVGTGRFFPESTTLQSLCFFVHVMSIIGDDRPKLFDPALSRQRFAAVHQAVKQHRCRSILDLGCGEGRFLTYLLTESPFDFVALHGVDISERGLRRAVQQFSEKEISKGVSLNLACGNVFDVKDVLEQEFDAVVMIEVVEHLDPDPLSKVGETVLGKLQPKLFVVTTPNWEYNRLLQDAEELPKGNCKEREGIPFRCSDHRFEWTRNEFASWASDLAETFNYDVSFSGIGSMVLEEEICEGLRIQPHSMGCASQMCVFVRRSQSSNSCENSCPLRLQSQLETIWTNESHKT